MNFYPHAFEGPIERHDLEAETYVYTVLYVPPAVAASLPLAAHPRLRIEGEIADHPWRGALNPSGGRWHLLLSRGFLRQIGRDLGDVVEARFAVAAQDAVETPAELAAALAADAAAAARWAAMKPGAQRGLAHRVASAKGEATRAARVAEAIEVVLGRRALRTRPARRAESGDG